MGSPRAAAIPLPYLKLISRKTLGFDTHAIAWRINTDVKKAAPSRAQLSIFQLKSVFADRVSDFQKCGSCKILRAESAIKVLPAIEGRLYPASDAVFSVSDHQHPLRVSRIPAELFKRNQQLVPF